MMGMGWMQSVNTVEKVQGRQAAPCTAAALAAAVIAQHRHSHPRWDLPMAPY